MEQEKFEMTKEGYEKLKAEYDDLTHNKIPQVKEQLAEARAQGDLSENADYVVAREDQAKYEGRRKQLAYMLDHAEIISTRKGGKTVRMGSVVTIVDMSTKKKATYTIVGQVESAPLEGKISITSPLGAAVIDHKVGDVAEVNANKPYKVKIDKIA